VGRIPTSARGGPFSSARRCERGGKKQRKDLLNNGVKRGYNKTKGMRKIFIVGDAAMGENAVEKNQRKI
jgi:hypothetical protein